VSSRASNLYLRVGVVLVMAMFIGAPTPGYVSGCSTGSDDVDPVEYCRGKNERICARDQHAGRLDTAGYVACTTQIEAVCAGHTFAVGCEPTLSEVLSCFEALTDPTRVSIPAEALPECHYCDWAAGALEGI